MAELNSKANRINAVSKASIHPTAECVNSYTWKKVDGSSACRQASDRARQDFGIALGAFALVSMALFVYLLQGGF